ncbi:MAG: hypothetical protein A2910_03120 [Candidatus Yanofskybacteria bacterium RIFCSPLOWO2_01_FULL_39_28]|nr:MAG: hypothetical protein A2910_03120 [Candidatus Yanofskybacteria bacterium RIFCSPLOWO2_01_FULL_39_28]
MKNFLISAPFGNYITHVKCTSICGTYTLHKRGSWITRLYRAVTTIRPIKNGWVNRMELQNPGIRSIKKFNPKKIYSITAIQTEEWNELINLISEQVAVELNLSCPNIEPESEIRDHQVVACVKKFPIVIFKLSPTNEIYNQIDRLVNLGARYIHIANTLPTKRGGESGARLKSFSIKTIKNIRAKYPNIKIIGGGGIYSDKDVELYEKAGADYFSLATIWFNPWKAIQLLKNSTLFVDFR